MKNKYLFLIGVIVLLIVVALYFLNSYRNRNFTIQNLKYNNIVINNTDISYVDTIVHVASYLLNQHGNLIDLYPLNDSMVTKLGNNFELKSYIVGKKQSYKIYINVNLTRREYVNLILHELIHLSQIELGKLRILTNNTIIWNDVIINPNLIDYEKRPWEIDCFKQQYEIYPLLIQDLYQ